MVPSFDRDDFKLRLDSALALISASNTIDAHMVYQTISSNRVKILSFFELSEKHFSLLREDYMATDERLPSRFPASDYTIHKIESKICGYIFLKEGVIYVGSQLTVEQLAKTLVHEVFHFLNKELSKKEENLFPIEEAIFRDEVRSFLAETCLDNKKLTRSQVTDIHQMVINAYDLLDDKKKLAYQLVESDLSLYKKFKMANEQIDYKQVDGDKCIQHSYTFFQPRFMAISMHRFSNHSALFLIMIFILLCSLRINDYFPKSTLRYS